MNKQFNSILLNEPTEISESTNKQSLYIGGAFVLLNLFLMISVGIYWTNTAVHQYFSGRPL